MEPPDVTQDGGTLGRHLGFCSKLEILLKFTFFDTRHVEYDIIKHFASFCQHFVLLSPKKMKNTNIIFKMSRTPAIYDVISLS